jgi:phage tail sheath gpL-like
MTVPFANIPSNILVPLFYGEVNATQANTALPIQRTLVIGQKTGIGTGITDSVVRVLNSQDAITQAGPNSNLAQMVDDYRLNDPAGELWIALLHDDPAAVAATGSITFTAVATAAGTYTVYIGGRKYAIAVTTSMLVADLATALTAAINGDKRATVTAVAVAGAVNLTADCKGAAGNDCPIYENYYGTAGGEAYPKGLATTVVQFASGATNPSLANILSACGDRAFDFIVCPYTDTTSLNALQTFLNDQTGRWSWTAQVYGHVFFAASANLSTLLNNYGSATRNNQHESVMGWKNAGSPAWRLAAAYAGACAASLRNDPAQPLQTVQVLGMLPPARPDRFQLTDRNTLLHNGVSTFTVADDGTMRLENVVTTYQQNAFGQADNSYLEVETLFTIMAVLRRLKTAITSKYARTKLASPDTPIAPGANVVTTTSIKGELIAQYRGLCLIGLCQSPDAFKAGLVVEQDANNPNRVNVLYDPVLMAQLRVFAVLFQFRNTALNNASF